MAKGRRRGLGGNDYYYVPSSTNQHFLVVETKWRTEEKRRSTRSLLLLKVEIGGWGPSSVTRSLWNFDALFGSCFYGTIEWVRVMVNEWVRDCVNGENCRLFNTCFNRDVTNRLRNALWLATARLLRCPNTQMNNWKIDRPPSWTFVIGNRLVQESVRVSYLLLQQTYAAAYDESRLTCYSSRKSSWIGPIRASARGRTNQSET